MFPTGFLITNKLPLLMSFCLLRLCYETLKWKLKDNNCKCNAEYFNFLCVQTMKAFVLNSICFLNDLLSQQKTEYPENLTFLENI